MQLSAFADDEACTAFLERLRWPEGFVCPECGSSRSWRAGGGHWWMCANCGRKTSVIAGTIFEGTRTPLSSWFAAAWLIASSKQRTSAAGLQRALGLGSYQTAWMMLHRFRVAMAPPHGERLTGRIEIGQTHVWDEARAGPSGPEARSIVAIAVELHGKGLGRVRLGRIQDAAPTNLTAFLNMAVERGSTVRTNRWSWSVRLRDHGYTPSRSL